MVIEKVEKDVVVGINYRLTVSDGTEVDATEGREPLEYLHGHENIIPGLEKALEGFSIGDELDMEFDPEEAYGVRDPEREIEVTREQLGFDVRRLLAKLRAELRHTALVRPGVGVALIHIELQLGVDHQAVEPLEPAIKSSIAVEQQAEVTSRGVGVSLQLPLHGGQGPWRQASIRVQEQ